MYVICIFLGGLKKGRVKAKKIHTCKYLHFDAKMCKNPPPIFQIDSYLAVNLFYSFLQHNSLTQL